MLDIGWGNTGNWVNYGILGFNCNTFSAILQYSCDHDLCRAAKARSECTDLAADDTEAMTVLLLRRDGWVICIIIIIVCFFITDWSRLSSQG